MSEDLKMIDKKDLIGRPVVKVVTRFYPATGFASKVITMLPFRQFSHVSRVFHFDNGYKVEFESIQGLGVVWHVPRSGRAYEAYRKRLTHPEMQELFEFSLTIEGKYDWWGCIGFALKKAHHNAFKWFCSEIQAYCDYKTGHPASRRAPYQETPTSYWASLELGKRSPEDEDMNWI